MKFKKIDENKISIILSTEDLLAHNIDINNFKSNSVAYQQLFWDMMEHAQEELGFDVSDSQLFVETTPDANGNFIITITKSLGLKGHSDEFEKLLSNKMGLSGMIDIGPSFGYDFTGLDIDDSEFDTPLDSPYELVKFENIEHLIDLAINHEKFWSLTSALYSYKNNYFVIVKRNSRNNNQVNKFIHTAYEYNAQLLDAIILIPIIKEHGKAVISKKAIRTLAENFS